MAIERFALALVVSLLSVASALGLGVGCASNDTAGSGYAGPPGSLPGAGSGNLSEEPGMQLGDAGAPLPPEKELDQSFRAPVATGRVLWSANPDSGRVALIDVKTLTVRMTNAGFGPTYLAAVPSKAGTDSAIVINVGSHDASWFVATASNIETVTIATHVGANAWSISADGHFAIAWTDAARLEGGTPDSVNGYSELTVIDLSASPPTSTRLSVGFRPSQVVFDAAAEHAFVVVDEGISVLTLGEKPALSDLYAVSATDQPAHARDVNFSADGSFAVVRVDGSDSVEIIDLGSQRRQLVTLESSVTDLDLSADGKTAIAVLGNALPPKVVRFAVPTPEPDPANFDDQAVPGEVVRSVTVSPNGELALLYANAVPNSHLTLLDLRPNESAIHTLDLQGALQSVYVAPDSQTAITFQAPPLAARRRGSSASFLPACRARRASWAPTLCPAKSRFRTQRSAKRWSPCATRAAPRTACTCSTSDGSSRISSRFPRNRCPEQRASCLWPNAASWLKSIPRGASPSSISPRASLKL